MTAKDAKKMISEEFMNGFYEWLKDESEMTDEEFGRKYGWGRVNVHKDNLKGLYVYREYVFTGRYAPGWKKAGYDINAIWELKNEGWLSYTHYWSPRARALGREDFYYISKNTAREIYKAAKAASNCTEEG